MEAMSCHLIPSCEIACSISAPYNMHCTACIFVSTYQNKHAKHAKNDISLSYSLVTSVIDVGSLLHCLRNFPFFLVFLASSFTAPRGCKKTKAPLPLSCCVMLRLRLRLHGVTSFMVCNVNLLAISCLCTPAPSLVLNSIDLVKQP